MRYKAHCYPSLSELKNRNGGLAAFLSTTIGGALVGQFATTDESLAIVMSGYAVLILAVAWLAASGKLARLRKSSGKSLFIEDGRMSLTSSTESVDSVPLSELEPVAHYGRYRPWGSPWKVEYVCLRLNGGPLGERELYFEHDGDYMKRAWERSTGTATGLPSGTPAV